MTYNPSAGGGGLSSWTTGTSYTAGQVITYQKCTYICLSNHSAGSTFEGDISAGYWELTNSPSVGRNYALAGNNFESNTVGGWTAAKVPATTGTTNGFPNTALTAGLAFANSYYVFTITSGSATVGATYTNNTQTFTVAATISAKTQLVCTGTGAPAASGTLTKATGTGDATITFSAYSTTNAAHLSAPAVESTAPLSGSYSLKMASDSTGPTAGDMYVSEDYNLNISDQGKALQIKFAYQLSGDTNSKTDFSGTYSANTYAVAIYDVTNGAWIQPAGCFNFVQKTGVGTYSGTFQTPSNMTKFQVVVYVANTVASATTATLLLDDFYVGPQTFSQGPAMSDWQSYTPTFTNFGNVTNIALKYRRVGDSLEVIGNFTTGSPAAGVASISLPSGLSIDTNKLAGASTNSFIGIGSFANATANTSKDVIVISAPGTSTSNVYFTVFDYAASNNALTPQNGSAVFNGTTNTSITFRVPITGWSSSSVQSADTDTRVVSAFVIGLSGGSGSGTVLPFATTKYDTHGGISGLGGSSFKYTCQVSGFYLIEVLLSNTTSGNVVCLYKNGSLAYGNVNDSSIVAYSASGGGGSIGIQLNAGDYVDVRNNAANSFSWGNFRVTRISGPAVVQAPETVACDYFNTAGTTVGTSDTVIPYAVKQYDTHNAYNTSTGVYTIPVSGKYKVTCYTTLAATNLSTANALQVNLYKNGALNRQLAAVFGNGTSQSYRAGGSTTLSCLAGDTLSIYTLSSVSTTLATTSGYNYLQIERVGN